MASSYLTREGYQKSEQELNFLRTVKRKEVAERLQDAMEDGELIENAEFEAAKNEQSFVEGRIKDLEILLANAHIIGEEVNTQGIVKIGSKVTIKEEGFEPECYMIVGPAEANPLENRISNESPIGHALINHKVGEKIKVETPSGATEVEILKIE
ncbi:MAG: transcription elongation factor GreA [Anaerolineaceae bacterium]|jgi:transcription elongation factor GreA|nr:transcription elongation factor GreA [Anaerolineaceae bacterium]MDD4042561.1 transcription elongation factor GreA [Anaerolineaceae bacterium]MDD4578334.1 transcription elongation factor GreA [Anaerolineaceae bacterium]